MFPKSLFKRRIIYQATLLALILAIIITGVVYAVLINRKLSGNMVSGGRVGLFEISPDGNFTVFIGDVRIDDKLELFSVPTTGGNRVLLSPNIPGDCYVNMFYFTPDSQHIIYPLITETSHEHCGLYAVPSGGGTPIELIERLPSTQMLEIKITGDGTKVLFILETPIMSRIYTVSVSGGENYPISNMISGSHSYEIAPNSQYVVIREKHISGEDKLYRSNMAGIHLLLDKEDEIYNFQITPDGTRVIYIKEDLSIGGKEIWSVPITGGTPTKLNGDLDTDGDVHDFKISPNSAYVVYWADESRYSMDLLYQAPVDGGTARIILTPKVGFVSQGDVTEFDITPNSLGVVFIADKLMDERNDLFSVGINGGPIYRLNPGMIADGDVWKYTIAPNSLGVVFIADYFSDGVDEIFGFLINGMDGVRLNPDLPPGGNVFDFQIAHNSLGVVYLADQDVYSVFNLYAVPIIGGQPPVRINLELESNRGVAPHFMITPDNKGVVYRADQEKDEVIELFITYDYDMIYMPLMMR